MPLKSGRKSAQFVRLHTLETGWYNIMLKVEPKHDMTFDTPIAVCYSFIYSDCAKKNNWQNLEMTEWHYKHLHPLARF